MESCLNDLQLAWKGRKALYAVCGDHNIVFDTHAAEARHIDARLDRKRCTPGQRRLLGRVQVRRLMNLDAQAMAGAVEKLWPIPAGLDHVTRCRVDLRP